jgi:hypothetical protein
MMSDRKKPIDMQMRLVDDGGPLFDMINHISDPEARKQRLCDLAYVGLLVEQGRLDLPLTLPMYLGATDAVTFLPAYALMKRNQKEAK